MKRLQTISTLSLRLSIHQAEIARPEDGGILDTHFLHANRIETAVFQFNVKLLRGGTQPWVRIMDTHGNFWMQPTDFDIPPAAFFDPDPEPTTLLKPEPIKPTKPEAEKPEKPEKPETSDTPPDTERNVSVKRKLLTLWAKLKRE